MARKSTFKSFSTGLKFTKYLARYSVNLLQYPFMEPKTVFNDIYNKNIWDNRETVSGDSSTKAQTRSIRRALPLLIKKYKIKSVLDIPCGDFNWMQNTDLGVSYTGADIVDSLIKINSKLYPEAGEFLQLDICNDFLPNVDLIFCRDCLVHLSFAKIFDAIANIKKSGAKYLLITTFPGRAKNRNIITGAWRALNFEKTPFNFPLPLEIINEKFKLRGKRFTDKSMGLWVIKDIP